jgi:hypothetical protein
MYNGSLNRQSLQEWWRGRCIPGTRNGIIETLEPFGSTLPAKLLPKGYNLSLSDQYWLCPKKKNIKWKDINFFENDFSLDFGLFLFGKKIDLNTIDLNSPDVTTDGWLKKRWVIKDGKRLLYKAGSHPYFQEPFNEVLATRVMEHLGVPHIPYSLVWEGDYALSVCETFITKDTELIPAHYILWSGKRPNNMSDYNHFLKRCVDSGLKDTKFFINQMLTVDFIIANEDRHYNNFGIIRDATTLKWLKFAPVFDNGTSLWYYKNEPNLKIQSKPFKSWHSDQIKLISDFDWLDFNKLKCIDEEFEEILKENPWIDAGRRGKLALALKDRINYLHSIIHNTKHKLS